MGPNKLEVKAYLVSELESCKNPEIQAAVEGMTKNQVVYISPKHVGFDPKGEPDGASTKNE